MCYLAQILSAMTLAQPPCDADARLLVGMTSVIAASIETDGFRCGSVGRIEEGSFENEGRVLKVTCLDPQRVYKVVAYTEGDFVAAPWTETLVQP